MIEFVGSSYQYQGEILDQPEIIYIQDHHYNEESQHFPVQQLLENSTCDPILHTVIFDHVLRHDDQLTNYNLIFFPKFLAWETQNFLQQNITVDWTQKSTTFNFMINKPRLHRSFLLLLIDHFKLANFSYSFAWRDSTVEKNHMLMHTYNLHYRAIIEQSCNTVVSTNYVFGPEKAMDRGVRNGNIPNAQTYDGLLKHPVFEPACVSLITEPVFFERETIVTEKTLMAMYGGTIPIWVGGWRIADYLRDLGFDVFDDVVDHSYQDLPDPWDRCYYAVERNLHLLQNFDAAQKFVYSNKHRFEENLKLLKNNIFATRCHSVIDSLPEKIKKELIPKLSWLTHNDK